MNDIIPDDSNRLATWIGRIFHPALMGIPTLLAILSEMDFTESLRWMSLMLGILLTPTILLQFIQQRRGYLIYQRHSRAPLYVVGWISVLVCWIVLIMLQAPRVLIACLLALLMWIPLQLFINQVFTKISIHTAVVSGCLTGLLMLDKLENPLLKVAAFLILVLTAWARMTTKNHTLSQVIWGVVIGALPVLLIFPVALR